jgi:uncharacterized protein YbjT (DUF2867 family)
MSDARPLVLLTGATGYVGGRLLRALEAQGRPVRCLARRPEHLAPRVTPGTQVVAGDVLQPATLAPALEGVHTACYLVHSMAAGGSYAEDDRRGAEAFAAAARGAGVRRIVYLGGLGDGDRLSQHLASRQEVGTILRRSAVPTIEFRASIVLGSGSLSFELIRALVEKLPVMITPGWVRTRTQPIGIEDLVSYLVEALDLPEGTAGIYEIGGPDRVSYGDLMREYAARRGLRRLMIPVPVLSPRLSSLWLALVSPVYARVGRELVAGLRNETVVHDDSALRVFSVRPRGVREALARALANEDLAFAATRWSDALSAHGAPPSWGGIKFGSRLVDSRTVRVAGPPARAFRAVARIGGGTGWYYGRALWLVRGMLDRLVGGPGLRRGRRDPYLLAPGDTVDFWRVEAVEPGRLLRLAAEMRLPGRAWLQFEVTPEAGGTLIRQTALFDPVGVAGLVYWYTLWLVHQVVFGGMLRNLARAAEREESDGGVPVTPAPSLRSG